MEERIKMLREILSLSQLEFAEKISIDIQTVINWELGEVIENSFIEKLCCDFNVNKKWLETGEGIMFKENN